MAKSAERTKLREEPAPPPASSTPFEFEKAGLNTKDMAALLTAHMKGVTGPDGKISPTYVQGPRGMAGLVDEMARAIEWLTRQKQEHERLTKLLGLLYGGRLAMRYVDATPPDGHPMNPPTYQLQLFELAEGEPIT